MRIIPLRRDEIPFPFFLFRARIFSECKRMRGLCGFVSLSRMGPRTRYPIQNLRASTKGAVVRVGQSFPVKERQEVAFLGFWWIVDKVRYDLSAVNPQAAAFGDPMKNAVVELTLIGSGRKAE